MTTSIWERTYNALIVIDLPTAANVYIPNTDESFPDDFMTYTLVSNTPELEADDVLKVRSYRVQVSYFSRNGLNGMPDIDSVMTAAGFTIGPATEIPYNQTTGHFGLALEYVYMEDKE